MASMRLPTHCQLWLNLLDGYRGAYQGDWKPRIPGQHEDMRVIALASFLGGTQQEKQPFYLLPLHFNASLPIPVMLP